MNLAPTQLPTQPYQAKRRNRAAMVLRKVMKRRASTTTPSAVWIGNDPAVDRSRFESPTVSVANEIF